MELSWKKYAAAVTAAVCLLVPVTETGIAGAEDSAPGGWDSNEIFGTIYTPDYTDPWVTGQNGTLGGWGDPYTEEVDEVSLYVTETPDPTAEELKADHISGQNGAMFYNIDKKSGENGEFDFSSGLQDGFKASWSDLESLTIEKGKSFKKPVSASYFRGISVDYRVILENFTGEQFDIGAKCRIGTGGDSLYIVNHFGEFVPGEDMTELVPFELNGMNYQLYKKKSIEKIDGTGEYIHEDYYMVCVRDIKDLTSVPSIISSVMIKDLINAVSMSYSIPPLSSCGFYVDTHGGSGDMEVQYIQANCNIMSGNPGMYPWNTNVWGTTENDEDARCVLYPDEDGYYYYNSGTHLAEDFNFVNIGSGTEITCVNDFGSGDNSSLNVKCSKDNFQVESAERFSALVGNVGEPFRKGSTWGDGGFSFGPLWPADEDYEESEISYDISVDVYNCSDEEAEFSLEIGMPWSGFDTSEEVSAKTEKYDKNIVCKKTVKPHEWATLSNPNYAMPRALTGDLIMYTTDEIEYYADNIYVKQTEEVSNVKGDINGDGVLDSLDLAKYRKSFFTGSQKRILPRRADIDGDGNVLMNDLVLLKRFLMGIDKEFAVVENTSADKRESGETNGFYYESFIKEGVGELVYDVKEDGCFDCSICVSDEAAFECGMKPEGGVKLDEVSSLYHVYEGNIASEDGYLFGIHGTFADSDDEFYIIEDSGHDSRFAGLGNATHANIEGYNYRFYVLNKTRETPEGKVRYKEYWSVLDDCHNYSKCCIDVGGQINILKHLGNYEKYFGVKFTDRTLSSIGVYVGGSRQYSPSFSVTRNELFIGRE